MWRLDWVMQSRTPKSAPKYWQNDSVMVMDQIATPEASKVCNHLFVDALQDKQSSTLQTV